MSSSTRQGCETDTGMGHAGGSRVSHPIACCARKESPEASQFGFRRARATWRERHEIAEAQSAELRRRISKLEDRRERLLEVFLYEDAIDEETYREQRAKISQELTTAEMALQDARIEELDVQGILGFADEVLTDAALGRGLAREQAPVRSGPVSGRNHLRPGNGTSNRSNL